MSKAFCKLIRIIPVNRLESKPVNTLFVRDENVSLNGSCENHIDIYRECYYPLDIR